MAALIAAHTGVDLGHLVGIWASPDCLSEVQKSLVVTESRNWKSAPQILVRLWATRDFLGKSDRSLAWLLSAFAPSPGSCSVSNGWLRVAPT